MNMRRFCIASLLAAVSMHTWAAGGAPASAGKSSLDVNGTWNAKVERGSTSTTMQFVFKQEKDKLTGTMSTDGAAPVEISNGKVYKTKITFQVESTMPAMPAMPGMPAPPANQKPQKMITRYEATVNGDSMVIEPQMGGGGSMGGGMPMGGGGGGGRMGGGMGGGGMGGGGMGGGGMGGAPPAGGGETGGAPAGGGETGGAPSASGGGMPGGMGGMRGGMSKITATRAR